MRPNLEKIIKMENGFKIYVTRVYNKDGSVTAKATLENSDGWVAGSSTGLNFEIVVEKLMKRFGLKIIEFRPGERVMVLNPDGRKLFAATVISPKGSGHHLIRGDGVHGVMYVLNSQLKKLIKLKKVGR